MTPIQLTDLRIVNCGEEVCLTSPVSESEVLPLFTDEALVGELVKRGVGSHFDVLDDEGGQHYSICAFGPELEKGVEYVAFPEPVGGPS